jgi:hypothetical protein
MGEPALRDSEDPADLPPLHNCPECPPGPGPFEVLDAY